MTYFRIYLFLFAIICLVPCVSNGHSHFENCPVDESLPVAKAMRELQARYQYLYEHDPEVNEADEGEYWSWPSSISGLQAPAYPPDGFYREDLKFEESRLVLIKALRDLLWHDFDPGNTGYDSTIFKRFVKEAEGETNVIFFDDDDMKYLNSIQIDAMGSEAAFGLIHNDIRQLTAVRLTEDQLDVEESRMRTGSAFASGCTAALDAAWDDYFWNADWEDGGVHVTPEVHEQAYTDGSGTTASLFAMQVRYAIDTEGLTGGSAQILLKVQPGSDGLSNEPPVVGDGVFRLWEEDEEAVEPEVGSLWISPWLGGEAYFEEIVSCPNGQVRHGWFLEEMVVIVTPDFEELIVDVECCGESDLRLGKAAFGSSTVGLGLGSNGGVAVVLDLGLQGSGDSFGTLWIDAAQPSSSLATPSGLSWTVADENQVHLDNWTGDLSRIETPDGQTTIQVPFAGDGKKYHIDFRHSGQFSRFRRYVVENVSSNPLTGLDQLLITQENENGNTIQKWRYEHSTTMVSGMLEKAWTLSHGYGSDDERRETRSHRWNSAHTERINRYLVTDGTGAVSFEEEIKYRRFPWGGGARREDRDSRRRKAE